MGKASAAGAGAGERTHVQWTEAQLAAIGHGGGDLLVSAAAGSGKTAVLAERCARLVCDGSADNRGERCGVENLLVLTFTEAAANEMRARIGAAIRARLTGLGNARHHHRGWLRRQAAMVDRASISTLHAFCARVLRQHFHEALSGSADGGGVDPAFEVMDEDESRLLQDEVIEALFARWHRTDDARQAEHFAAFFEDYAQGKETACREMILAVHRMLASTADPAAYVAAARNIYADCSDGCDRTLNDLLTRALGRKLHVAAAAAHRACVQVSRIEGTGLMEAGLQEAAEKLGRATELARQGVGAWHAIQQILAHKLPRLASVASVDDFEELKKRTWKQVKKSLEGLNDDFAREPLAMRQDLCALALPLGVLLELVADFQRSFTAAKRAENRLDFADLERLTLDLLMRDGNLAAAELRKRYHYLLVDEFQDINPLQAALLEKVRCPVRFGGRGNLFVVGDVKQSIYAFRLADPGLFLEREQRAREAAACGAKQPGQRAFVALPHNFRSQQNLIRVMNRIFERILTPEIAGIVYDDGHALQPGRAGEDRADGGLFSCLDGTPVEVHLVALDRPEDDDTAGHDEEEPEESAPGENLSAVEEEARMVAERIKALLAGRRLVERKEGMPRKIEARDIAILLRSMKGKAMIFARALARLGIPVHAELSTGYFDTPEVTGTLALLHVLDNAQQDIPLATAMLGPYGGFAHDDLARIRLTFDRREVPFAHAAARYVQLGQGRECPHVVPGAPAVSPELAGRLGGFFEKLARWREKMRSRPLHEALAEIFDESKILPYLAGLEAGSQRIANLQMLHQRALTFASFRKQGLHRFLRFIERVSDEGDAGEAPVLSEASNVVRIMSVHKSKGLEFPVVFASGLGSKLILNSRPPLLVHRELGIGLYVADAQRNVFYPSAASMRIVEEQRRALRAEELRLLYVALTRARDCLVLTGHVPKAGAAAEWRAQWSGFAGPLPEDVLLRGERPLDWLMPAIATGCTTAPEAATQDRLHVSWDGNDPGAQVQVILHAPSGGAASSDAPTAQQHAERIAKILAMEPLTSGGKADERVADLIERVTGRYAYERLARQPAVQTVSFLKTLQAGRQEPEEAAPVRAAGLQDPGHEGERLRPRGGDGKDRGTATHRVLELLDIARCDTPEAITEQIGLLAARKLLPEDQVQAADAAGICWLLTQSAAGARLAAAARRIAAGDRTLRICREIPFTWAAPPDPGADTGEPADWPTIRGIIDVLLVDAAAQTAEILDYKTDAPFLWEQRQDDYQRQMKYYLRAASDILRFRVSRATLLFLSPQREMIVSGEP